mgnify:CR=1 FL=1
MKKNLSNLIWGFVAFIVTGSITFAIMFPIYSYDYNQIESPLFIAVVFGLVAFISIYSALNFDFFQALSKSFIFITLLAALFLVYFLLTQDEAQGHGGFAFLFLGIFYIVAFFVDIILISIIRFFIKIK